ncbi:MAG: hyaluronate lyase [Hyperthermus sp.]|nr:MAG: hyaluronate lyase [Hyperthermus sp.]
MKVKRREFLKLAGLSAALASLNWDRLVKKALAAARSGEINIVWFEAQDCAGNTTALIQATEPDLVDVLAGRSHVVGPGTVKLPFHETVMPEWGEDALAILRKAVNGELDPFVLVLEGSFPVDEKAGGPNGSSLFCYIGDENGKPVSCLEWLRRLLPRAVAVVAVGNCASYGGLVANNVIAADFFKKMGYDLFEKWSEKGWSKSPTGAVGFFPDPIRGHKGVVDLLPEARPFRRFVRGECVPRRPGEADCRPAVAVPGCPANGNGQLRVLANLVLWAKGILPLPELDEYWRPKFIFGPTVHEQCPRAAWYAAGDFRKYPGEPSARCLYSVGCKGPVSNCPWNKVGWVNGVGGPTRTGGVCIGCTMPGFTDAFEPFYEKLPYVGASKKALKEALKVGVAATVAAGVLAGIWAYSRGRQEEGGA